MQITGQATRASLTEFKDNTLLLLRVRLSLKYITRSNDYIKGMYEVYNQR